MQAYFKKIKLAAALLVCQAVITSGNCYADESGRTLFLENVFQGPAPAADYIWITPSTRRVVESILGHEYSGMRIKYWRKSGRTVWILSDMAREKPVCAAIVVFQGKIQSLEILSAEGRWGSLVKNENFTSRFQNISSDENNRLTRSIDGITGATISVNAVSRLARLSLALDKLLTR